MTLKEIILKYDEDKHSGYHKDSEDYYNDTRKKLQRAFQCLGVYDMSIFKDSSGEYCFKEENVPYLFDLIDKEQHPLFKKIRNKEITENDISDFVDEIEDLFCFLKECNLSKNYKDVICEIASNVNYPVLCRFVKNEMSYNTLLQCYRILLFDKDWLGKISGWEYLLKSDKIMLLDELEKATQKWLRLAIEIANHRETEHLKNLFQSDLSKLNLYSLVEASITDEVKPLIEKETADSKKYKKPRNLSAEYNRMKKTAQKFEEQKLIIVKQFCQENNLDFERYLQEKKAIDTELDYPKITTQELLEKYKDS